LSEWVLTFNENVWMDEGLIWDDEEESRKIDLFGPEWDD
jgi:hypothetical protein